MVTFCFVVTAGLIPVVAVRAGTTTQGSHSPPCSGQNLIVCENQREGAPRSEWDVPGAGDLSLQGFATSMSVSPGDRVTFKIRTDARTYGITIYRLGYYGGDGARRVDEISPSAPLPQVQPPCLEQAGTGLIDCGTWAESAQWEVPEDSVSGIYVARLSRGDTGGASHILFVVRDDSRSSDIIMQTADTTWQAYNTFGGRSFYTATATRGRAVKVSYNRPLVTRGLMNGRDSFFANEFAMVQFLEANGLDVSYSTSLDTVRRSRLLSRHRIFLSVGHDEYWTGAQRASVERARDSGVALAFFGGNSVYWRARWEPSVLDDAGAMRTLVCYKESWSDGKSDPSPQWTGTWRDSSPQARHQPGVRPENALTGTAYRSNSGSYALRIPTALGRFRLWRETTVASQPAGRAAVLGTSLIGYEFDEDLDNNWRPPGLIRLTRSAVDVDQYLMDDGAQVGPARAVHSVTMYRAPSGSLVFSAGTIQWSFGLGMLHVGELDGSSGTVRRSEPIPAIQQATLNVLADMGARASTPLSGLVATEPSFDQAAPTVTIAHPLRHARVRGPFALVRGRARDIGGHVAAVEYSSDRGRTWHPVHGRDVWKIRVPLVGSGRRAVLVRAVDDSANVGRTSTVPFTATCPCSAMTSMEPRVLRESDRAARRGVEIGTVFTVHRGARLRALRFYEGPGTPPPTLVRLWSRDGDLLWEAEPDRAVADGVGGRGWHVIPVRPPVPLARHHRYVASMLVESGGYAVSPHVLDNGPIRRRPISLLSGVFRYGTDRRMPTATYAGSLYPIDPVVADD